MAFSLESFLRYEKYVHITDSCWLWIGYVHKSGYGVLTIQRKVYYAHRAAYAFSFGELPPSELNVCHICDNKLCVRPDHFFLGTDKENIADSIRKGRFKMPARLRGSNSPVAKLNEQDVVSIRSEYNSGMKVTSLSKKYGVHVSTIYGIISGREWSHLKS